MKIVWGAAPPKKAGPGAIGLLSPLPGENRPCVLLGPLVGLQTHWVNGRTIPCTGSEDCRVHHEPQTWKGFAPVLCNGWTWRGKTPGSHLGVLVVTAEIGEDVLALHRGSKFTVHRLGTKRNSPLSLTLEGQWKDGVDLPEAFDVKPFVLRATGLGNPFLLRIRKAQ